MAFRTDSKVDAFQRQINALRHQLGGESDDYRDEPFDRSPALRPTSSYRDDFLDANPLPSEPLSALLERSADGSGLDIAGPELPAVPSIDAETSVIAHSTAWSGALESTGSLHVYGRVEGTLTARDDIFVAEEADVDAVIVAANVTVAGNVRGSIHCAKRFEILPHGRVSADVRAPAIVIHDGALLAGQVAMAAVGETRGKLAAVPAARAANGGD